MFQEMRGYVPPEAMQERPPEPEEKEEEVLPSSQELIENFILWRPTLKRAMKEHGEKMNPPRTVEQLIEEAVKSLDPKRDVWLREIERLHGGGVKKAIAGMETGIILALVDKVDRKKDEIKNENWKPKDWEYAEPDLTPDEAYWFGPEKKSEVTPEEGEEKAA